MEPITTAMAAIAAVQKTVALIKAASAAGKDVASLGGLIGSYFDAKHQAVKAVREAKKEGGSNLGKAVQIELQLKEQADFEKQLAGLFFPNNTDIWQNIQKRVAQMDQEDKEQERRERDAARKAKRRQEEINEIMALVAALAILVALVGYGTWMVIEHCQTVRCGSK